jgi:hypothetical protein
MQKKAAPCRPHGMSLQLPQGQLPQTSALQPPFSPLESPGLPPNTLRRRKTTVLLSLNQTIIQKRPSLLNPCQRNEAQTPTLTRIKPLVSFRSQKYIRLTTFLGLLERRERKRIKRAIVQPKEPSEHGTASSNGDPKQRKRTKAKGKKSKVPSGFALMHGFTATNVGKNRLTVNVIDCPYHINLNGSKLKPPSNVGVFKKGKASFNAKIKPKPKGAPWLISLTHSTC